MTTRKTSDLTLDPDNARRRTERGGPQLTKSLEQFGAARSVVEDGEGIIRAGNGTVEAAIAAGIVKVKYVEGKPDELVVVRRKDLTGEAAKAYAIADNRTGELAEWDLDALEEQLAGLAEFTADDLGFDADDLEELFPPEVVPPEDVPPQIDRADELAKIWKTAEGQLWTVEGQQSHRLACGDSTSKDDVERLMQGDKVDLLLTDPPYGIDYNPVRSQASAATGKRKHLDKVIGDSEEFDPSHLMQIASDAIIWGANNFANKLRNSGGWLVWDKRDGGSVFRGFKMSDCELAYCTSGRMVRMFSHRWCGHLRDSEHREFLHPTQKPIALLVWCLEIVASATTVFDPYLRSGTTMLAAEQLNRRCFGMEISPKYCAVILQRMKDAGCECRLDA